MPLENKLYIQDVSIDEIKPILERIDSYFKSKNDKTYFYSKEEGIFLIEKDLFFQLKQIDKPIKYYKDFIETKKKSFSLILDESYYEKIPVISQLPVDYLNVSTTFFEFYNSPIVRFIVEGKLQNVNLLNNNKSRYEMFDPVDFYFQINENIDNHFVKEELNVFLSMFY